MEKYYCNGKKGFCDSYNGEITANCCDCEHHDSTGGKVIEFVTNYDRIRNMSVGEMAKLLAQRNFSCMRFCENCESCNQNTFRYPFCIDGIKKWLESEVEGE